MKESDEEKVKSLIKELRCLSVGEDRDPENDHIEADEILLSIISEYGHPEVREIFNEIDKWYA